MIYFFQLLGRFKIPLTCIKYIIFTAFKVSGKPDPKLYVWDVELDTLQFFNFETGHSEQDELLSQQTQSDKDLSEEER